MKHKIGTLQDLRHVRGTLQDLADNPVDYLKKPLNAGGEFLVGQLFSATLLLVERAIDRIESNPTREDKLA
jgi:hypothetical protein